MTRLIEAVATRRDRASFIALFEHFAPRVKTFALRSGASEATAEELARETVLTVWRKADSFVPRGGDTAAWIFTIARNLRIDALRRERLACKGRDIESHAEVVAYHEEQRTPEAQLTAPQLEGCARKALAQLPGEQLRAIELFFFEQKTDGEIANQLQVPLGTVKSRLRLALAQLRTLLEQS